MLRSQLAAQQEDCPAPDEQLEQTVGVLREENDQCMIELIALRLESLVPA